MSTDIVSNILAAAERLFPLYPRPDELDERTLEVADAAVDGVALVHYLGDHRLPIGRKNIGWTSKELLSHGQVRHFVYRMGFIEQLSKAYHVTGDERYAEAARDYFCDFMSAWPTDQIGSNGEVDSTLTLSGRNTGWARSLHLLARSAAFDADVLGRIVDFNAAQIQFLRQNVKPNINWRVFEARGLLTCGLYLAFLERAADWQRYAVRVLNDTWFRQILPDGVHCERNPIYHGGMANTFRDQLRLGRLIPELGLIMTVEGLTPMYDFVLACAKPNGYMCGIHDSQSEFTGHLRDGIHTDGHKAVDHIKAWEEFRRDFDLPLEHPPTSQVFPNAGLAFLRTSWDEDAAWMSFDATDWGSGHCHLSRNAIQLHAHRQSMVIDPGWLAYESSDWGLYGKSTRAHSTCNLNGLDQSCTNPRCFEHHNAPGYDAVFCAYEGGYWDTELAWNFTHATDGIWAEHGRVLLWVHDRFAFVADSMFRLPHEVDDPEAGLPSYECIWQLAPAAEISLDPDRDRAVAQWTDAGLLLLTPIRPDGSLYEVHTGETDPLRGWVPGNEKHHPAPQVVLNTPRMQRQHDYCVSVLVPYRGQNVPEVTVDAKSPMGQTGYVRMRWADGTEDTVYWACNFGMMLGTWPDFETDSSLVHLRKNVAGEVTDGCCVNGTFIEPFSSRSREKPETFLI